MKKLLLGGLITSLLSFAAIAAPKANKTIEPGLYHAVDIDSGTIKAQLQMNADSTVQFKVQAPDFEMPEPGCSGTYTVTGTTLSAVMTCPLTILPEASVKIDISTVTPQSVRSEQGAIVPVMIDGLTDEPANFSLKIVE